MTSTPAHLAVPVTRSAHDQLNESLVARERTIGPGHPKVLAIQYGLSGLR